MLTDVSPNDFLQEHGTYITGDALNEVRIIGVATSFLILGIVLIGLDFESKVRELQTHNLVKPSRFQS